MAMLDPLRSGAIALDVMAVNRAPASAVAARQASRLRQVVAAAQQGSRLYRERYQGFDPTEIPLARLPVVARGELMARFSDWVTDRDLDLSAMRAFASDPDACGSAFLDRYTVWESSGTSGMPGWFVQDAQSMAVYDVLESVRRSAPRPLARWLDPFYCNERIAFIGATDGHFASHVSLQRLRRLNPWLAGATRSFSILQPTNALVDALNAFAPTVLATYPSVVALLADQVLGGGLRVTPREIWTGGEGLTAQVRRHVEHVMGCPVRNSYGASEFLAMGWECAKGRMHLNADWVILEPVDAQQRPVEPDELSHHVLLTHLANTVQPLIRYELSDQVRVCSAPCECGCTLPVIEVLGRQDDALMLRGDAGRSVILLPLAIMTVLEEEAGVYDFQLRQVGERGVALRLGMRGGDAARAAERSRSALRDFARCHGVAELRVDLELDQPLLHGRSGKVCRVLSRPTPACQPPI